VDFLTAAGRRLEYRWIPSRASGGATLVFLHEALGSAALWRDFPDRLAERTGAAALIYSRAGHGRSEPAAGPAVPHHFSHEALVVLPEVLAARGIERPVLVGHSDGATIALVHAVAQPGVAQALILEAPHVFVEEITVTGVTAARAAFGGGGLREKLGRWHDHVDPVFHRWADAWLDPAFRGWTMEPSLDRVSCPTFVIQGEPDPYGTRAQVDAIAGRVTGPVETFILPGAGHTPHGGRPHEVLEAMAGFIERVPELQRA
jgi:pimeloyl-ACP methyl ester carboxylesterase